MWVVAIYRSVLVQTESREPPERIRVNTSNSPETLQKHTRKELII